MAWSLCIQVDDFAVVFVTVALVLALVHLFFSGLSPSLRFEPAREYRSYSPLREEQVMSMRSPLWMHALCTHSGDHFILLYPLQ